MSDLENALLIALTAHKNQKDHSGKPYILHPLRILNRMKTKDEMTIALLHDVLEDSKINLKDLIKYGLNKSILEAINLLTRNKKQNYNDYIKKLSKNELARKIKIADLEDNLNLIRIKKLTNKDILRIKKYHWAINYLTRATDEK